MGSADLIRAAISNPTKVAKLLSSRSTRRRVVHEFGRDANKLYHSRGGLRDYYPNGIDIFEEDWDNLVILDACRYDSMAWARDELDLPGRLESRLSRGSQTPEWLRANFHGKELHDTVYVASGAMPQALGVETPEDPTARQRRYGFDLDVHELINVWQSPSSESMKADKETQSHVISAPEMREAGLRAAERYPQKRLVFHFSQPHEPYFGPTGRDVHERAANPWQAKLLGELDIPLETLREMYRENVEIAVRETKKLANELDGKTVVSADHGELLLERSRPLPVVDHSHPDRTYVKQLIEVPWLVIDGERRNIVAEEPRENVEEPGDIDTQEQLAALGYVE